MTARVVLGMLKTFIRSGESGSSAVNISSKCERCFIIIILVFSSALLIALALQYSKIVLVFRVELFLSSCSIFDQI